MSSLLAISSMTSSETKDVPFKDNLMSDNDNEEEDEEGILTNKAPMNASPDIENNKVKRRKKKKNKFNPSNDKEITCYDTTHLNQGVIELIDVKPNPRPLPDKPQRAQERANPLLQIHLPEERRYEPLYFPKGNTPVKVIYTKDQDTMTQVTVKEQAATQTNKQPKSSVGKKTSLIVLCSKGIIMVAAIVLISSSEEISKSKPCDLEKALKSISVNYNFPCKHHAIKEKATNLHIWGTFLLVVNFMYFILILILLLLPHIRKLLHPKTLMPKQFKRALFIVLACDAIIFSYAMVMSYNDVQKTKAAKSDINFDQLKTTMLNLLEKNYTSDNISSNNALSNNWNKFFIEYNCCAINQVQGTTNDFDSTPWCTTAGTCQATASQIPRTCCNYVSEDDYGSAPSTCHSSVNSGTYKSNCMIAIKLLSVINIEEYKISLLQVSLLIIATLEIADAILMLILTTEYAIFFKIKICRKIYGEWK